MEVSEKRRDTALQPYPKPSLEDSGDEMKTMIVGSTNTSREGKLLNPPSTSVDRYLVQLCIYIP